MRPLRLVIEGYTAFRERQELDFSELGLFAIIGPNGAGKSSILDAICLALYGRIPRIENAAEVSRFISHGAEAAVVRLEFSVGEQRYAVGRRYRPSGGTGTASLDRLDDAGAVGLAEGVTEVRERVREVVGMDYNAFRRSVLLPQGQFERFLRGSPADRRRLLAQLLDLKRFVDAGQLARRRAELLAVGIRTTGERLEALAHATPQALAQLERGVAYLAARVKALAKGVEQARSDEASCQAARQRATSLEEAADGWEEDAGAAEELCRERDAALAREHAAARSVKEAGDALRTAEAAGAHAEQWHASVVETTGDAGVHSRIEEALRARDKETEEIAGQAKAHQTALEACVAVKAEVGAARQQHEEATHVLERARADREEAVKDERGASEALGAARAAAGRRDRLGALEGEIRAAVERRDGAGARRDLAGVALAAAEDRRESLAGDHAAGVLLAALSVGDDCPVCRRPVAELPPAPAGELDDRLRAAVAELAAARDEHEAARTDAELAERDHAVLDGRRADLVTEIESAPALALEQATGSYRAAATRLSEAQEAKEAAVEAERHARSRLDAGGERGQRAERARGLSEHRRDDAVGRRDDAVAQLEQLLGSPLPEDVEAELAERRERLSAAASEVTEARMTEREARERLEAARELQRGLEQGSGARCARLAEVVTAARARHTSVALILGPSDGESAPAGPDVEWPAHLAALEPGFVTALTLLAEHAGEAADRERSAAAERERAIGGRCEQLGLEAREGSEGRALLEEGHLDAVAARAGAESERTHMAEQVGERALLGGQLEGEQVLHDDLRWLGRHLEQKALVNYLMGESLEELCDLASVRLDDISAGRYALQADDDSSFRVIDRANADEVRDVETLCGGETFQASLALALALSEQLANLGGSVDLEAVFIDEGFASLDPESLELALDALEQLGREERMVGLISHTDRVPDRIQEGFEVVKGSGTSRVRVRTPA